MTTLTTNEILALNRSGIVFSRYCGRETIETDTNGLARLLNFLDQTGRRGDKVDARTLKGLAQWRCVDARDMRIAVQTFSTHETTDSHRRLSVWLSETPIRVLHDFSPMMIDKIGREFCADAGEGQLGHGCLKLRANQRIVIRFEKEEADRLNAGETLVIRMYAAESRQRATLAQSRHALGGSCHAEGVDEVG